jgi:hypothetical protein
MLDARYFRDQLPDDVTAAGEQPTVELRLLTGQVHRVRAIHVVADGYVILERYRIRSEESGWTSNSAAEQTFGGGAAAETERAVVPFESVLDVVVASGRPSAATRIGFGPGFVRSGE